MVTSPTRKQRSLEARESLILDHAHDLLSEKGYLGFNLDELAGRIEYAKGTIYLHFATKEDVVLGVVVRLAQERARLFRHAARFPGSTRERCAAIGMADLLITERRPQAFPLMQLVTTSSVWDKTSPARREEYRQAGQEIMEPGLHLVQEALLKKDITRTDVSAEQIIFGLFAMSKGAMLIEACPHGWPVGWPEFVRATIQPARHLFCDGVGWKPFSWEQDFSVVEARLRAEYFHGLL